MPTLGDLAAAVVQEVAPRELADFDIVVRGFDASGRAHERAQRGVDEETAAGLAEVGELMGGIIFAVGADLLKDAVTNGVKMSARRTLDLVRRRRATSGTELPALSDVVAEAGIGKRPRFLVEPLMTAPGSTPSGSRSGTCSCAPSAPGCGAPRRRVGRWTVPPVRGATRP